MSSPTASGSGGPGGASSHHMVPSVGYTTTGRPSTHQQQPMSFTRALEISENLDQQQSQQVQTRYLQTSNQQQQSSQPRQPSSLQPPSTSSSSNEAKQPQNNTDDPRRDSVYDMNSYEISV